MVVEAGISKRSNISELHKGRFDELRGRIDTIEAEMDRIGSDLNSDAFSRIGLRQPLVDQEGFPLAGIDIHRVRELRNRFHVLETDLRASTTEIEALLHEIHEHARSTGSVTSGPPRSAIPFGRVHTVQSGSPAESAGILVGDKVVKFGHLSCYRAEDVNICYDGIPTVMENLQVGASVRVSVFRLGRENEVLDYDLIPQTGRIGCLIKPL
jgi:26S proteasome non-ATPase regulatory subunit 9